VLFYREGQSVAQVAALLGLTEDATKQRLSRARTRLRADLAEKLGLALERTAPGSAFTAAVAAGLTTSASSSAAAAIAVGVESGAAASGSGAKAATAAGLGAVKASAAAALGASTGLLGVLVGFRHYWRRARDDEERRGIKRMAIMNLAAVLALSATVLWTSRQPSEVAGDAAIAVFLAVMGWINLVWLPRSVIARRLADERASDPLDAPRRQRRERVLGVVGFCLGEAVVLISLASHLVAR
jgi:hypothetical protein